LYVFKIKSPCSNLFSLASCGAIYVRNPHSKLVTEQLNDGHFVSVTEDDWHLILPYLKSNEEPLGISIEKDLLTDDGVRRIQEGRGRQGASRRRPNRVVWRASKGSFLCVS